MPHVLVALTCAGYQQHDPPHQAYSIFGVHDSHIVESLPAKQSIGLVVFFGGRQGERFDYSATIVDEKGNMVIDQPITTVILKRRNNVVLDTLKDVIFSAFGTYSININIDGICVFDFPYRIVPKKKHSTSPTVPTNYF